MDKTAPGGPHLEVGLVCDSGTSRAGIHGLTDLFVYAGQFAARRRAYGAQPPVRVTHWQEDEPATKVRCTYDSWPNLPAHPSVLVLPGNEEATRGGRSDSPMIQWLKAQHASGVVLAGVCGGVFVLARTGLLAGRQATTHWAFNHQFSAQFPDVLTETDHMVIDYGDVVTAGGVLAWADLGLRLVERYLGPTVMLDTARYMNVDPPQREQRFYSDFEPRTKHGDEAILKAQLWLSTQCDQAVTIADAASQACLEPRTFLRRFIKATGVKPSEYHLRLRISRARELLEFSRASIDQVAERIGYHDVGGFRRVFRKVTGLSPNDYRKRFSRSATRAGELAKTTGERDPAESIA